MSYMIIQYVDKPRKRGHHTICQAHGINKRICKQTPHELVSMTAGLYEAMQPRKDWVVGL